MRQRHSISGPRNVGHVQSTGDNSTDHPAPRLGMMRGRSTSSRTIGFIVPEEEQGEDVARATVDLHGLQFPRTLRGFNGAPFAAFPDNSRPTSSISASGAPLVATTPHQQHQHAPSTSVDGSICSSIAPEPPYCPTPPEAPPPPRRPPLIRTSSTNSSAVTAALTSPPALPKISHPGAAPSPLPLSSQNPTSNQPPPQSFPHLSAPPASPLALQSTLGVRRGHLSASVLAGTSGTFLTSGGGSSSGGGSPATPSSSAAAAVPSNASARFRMANTREAAPIASGGGSGGATAVLATPPHTAERRQRQGSAGPAAHPNSSAHPFRPNEQQQQQQHPHHHQQQQPSPQPQQLYYRSFDDDDELWRSAAVDGGEPRATSSASQVALCGIPLPDAGVDEDAPTSAAATATLPYGLSGRSFRCSGGGSSTLLVRSVSLGTQHRNVESQGDANASSSPSSSQAPPWVLGEGRATGRYGKGVRRATSLWSLDPMVEDDGDGTHMHVVERTSAPVLPRTSTSRQSCYGVFRSSNGSSSNSNTGANESQMLPLTRKPTHSVPGCVSRMRLFESIEALPAQEGMGEYNRVGGGGGGRDGGSGDGSGSESETEGDTGSDGGGEGGEGGDGGDGGGGREKGQQALDFAHLDQILDPLLDLIDPGRQVARRCEQRLQNAANGVGRLRAVESWADCDASRSPAASSGGDGTLAAAAAAPLLPPPALATAAPTLASLAGQALKLPCVGLEKLRDPEKRQKVVQRLREAAHVGRAAFVQALSNNNNNNNNNQRPGNLRWHM